MAVGGNDCRILRQECARDADGARQHAARIVAQIEDQALQIRLLRIDGGDLGGQIFNCTVLELGNADPGEAGLDHLGFDALHADFLALHCHHQWLVFIFAGDGQRNLGIRFAAHFLDRFVQRQTFDRGAVETGDQVAGLEPGAVGGRILDRRDHLDVAVFHADFDAETDKFAHRAFTQFLEGFLVEIGGMGVERGDHAGNGLGQQLLVVDRFYIIALDQTEYIRQLAQLFEGQRRRQRFLRNGVELQGDADAGDQTQTDQTEILEFATHFSPSSYPPERVERTAFMQHFEV